MREFTAEQREFRSAFRNFLENEVAPHMDAWREIGVVDRKIFRRAGEQGYLMIWPDERHGGSGERDFRYSQIVIEESARSMTSDWYATLHSRVAGGYIDRFATEEQKMRWLPRCASGEAILAIAMTEPQAGSDLAGMRTNAVDQGDHFLLNGSKTYISNGINADLVVVAAKTGDASGRSHQISLFIVERGMAGFTRGRKLKKIGMQAQDTAELFFSDVRVPRDNLIGVVGEGFRYLTECLAEERLISTVQNLAGAWKALEETRDFVMQRELFGKRLADLQNTQFKLAALEAELDVVQLYLDHCVVEQNAGRLHSNKAAKAKLVSSELQGRVVDECLQLHGGAGYMDEYPISRLYTEARINRIAAGSSEVMKLIIGRDLLKGNYQSFFDRH